MTVSSVSRRGATPRPLSAQHSPYGRRPTHTNSTVPTDGTAAAPTSQDHVRIHSACFPTEAVYTCKVAYSVSERVGFQCQLVKNKGITDCGEETKFAPTFASFLLREEVDGKGSHSLEAASMSLRMGSNQGHTPRSNNLDKRVPRNPRYADIQSKVCRASFLVSCAA